ncbi:MAG TPA: RdgB/HAM1 family non-canonical purine NTP pyrophosphatase [Tepidisphaeraceae bacterium]|jgi:XTP/dITP diphosphohydrolase|nr:RdgB/HAM1 family non-canonical purine NTP pyrophosphatase [Tepidisphaeraceae bacterium]
MKILIATGNAGKVKEFRQMLGSDQFTWTDLSAYPATPAIEETGHTFRANACLKAAGYARQFRTFALADDSGLEVDALDKKPGVHSARWSEIHNAGKGDPDNNRLLLKQLASTPDERRSARFVCVLALSDPDGRIWVTAQDSVEGTILREPRGTNGFGYDPIFLVNELGRTAAELSPDEKHRVSHRGKALRKLRQLMDQTGITIQKGIDGQARLASN